MKRTLILFSLLLSSPAYAGEFQVSTHAWNANGSIPASHVFNGFDCTGGNLSPDVEWIKAPADTKSFAITLYDPDAPTGSGWWHWTLFNLPATTTKIPKGASLNAAKLPKGAVEGMTDFGKSGYGGPCPPQGDKPHRYVMTVHALKTSHIDLPSTASGAMVGFYLHKNALATASVTGTYGR